LTLTRRGDMFTQEIRKLIDEFVRYVVFADRKKLPLTRADIVSKVLTNYKDKKVITAVFDSGRQRLKDIFGLELIDVFKDGKKADTSTIFMIKNMLPLELMNEIAKVAAVENKETLLNAQQKGLLSIILGIILLDNHMVESDMLNEKLLRLGFEPGRLHPTFGEWEKNIDRYVKEGYLVKKKAIKDTSSIFVYRFGPRSMAECSKRLILQVISDVYGVEGPLDPMLLKSIELEEQDDDEEEKEEEIAPLVTTRSTSSQASQRVAPPAASQNNLSQSRPMKPAPR
ncbi:hypothetical protein SAMD00019534_085580, partial [Acytostelium subglobosum LB1]|uniref:hypothetical protein n=1 Tax=Acytostelium subglobosum LB1 TaxID=1410327 RepID=UPI000644F44D